MYDCGEIREKLAEIKTLKEELVLKLPQAQNHKDTFILVNLQEEIEKKLEGLEEMLIIDIEELRRRHKEDKTLSKRELQFIYKLDGLFNREIVVEGGGENLENMRRQILRERGRENKIKQDLAKALNYREEQISLTIEEALSGNIKYHYGGLILNSFTSAEGLILPESMSGNLNLSNLISAKDLKLPKSIGGVLDLCSLTSAEDLNLPKSIGGVLDLHSLTSAKDLKLPESMSGNLYLSGLTSAVGLELPKSIRGDLYLNNLASSEGLELLGEIEGNIFLDKLPPEEKEELKRKYPHLANKIY